MRWLKAFNSTSKVEVTGTAVSKALGEVRLACEELVYCNINEIKNNNKGNYSDIMVYVISKANKWEKNSQ